MAAFEAKMANDTGLNVFMDNGMSYPVCDDHPNWVLLKRAFDEDDADVFMSLFDPTTALVNYVEDYEYDGTLSVVDGVLYYLGEALHNVVADKILHMMRENVSFEYMVKFLKNLMENPSKKSVEQLYSFLEHGNMPITSDGCFMAYKSVKRYVGTPFTDVYGREVKAGDYVDKYSGRIRNNIGDVVHVPRNTVDDDPHSACGQGLHCGALSYAGPDGWYHNDSDVIIVCKVNPRDAVSVPHDENHGKLRTCRYTVVGEFKNPLIRSVQDENTLDDDNWEPETQVEDVDLFADNYVDINSILKGDLMKCRYQDSHGEIKDRVVEVRECDDAAGHFIVRLLKGDPSYTVGQDRHRTFSYDGIFNIKFL